MLHLNIILSLDSFLESLLSNLHIKSFCSSISYTVNNNILFDDFEKYEIIANQYMEGTMPTYEYVCQSCGQKIEQFQGINDEPLKSCPDCSGMLKRLISGGTGFIMKGSSNLCYSSCGRDEACCESETSCGHSGTCGCH